MNPPLPKPRFTLTDTAGAPFDFWAKTEGYVTLLFFGYTRCPDECPLHMANVAMMVMTTWLMEWRSRRLPRGRGRSARLFRRWRGLRGMPSMKK